VRAAAVLIVDGITQPWNSAETADAPSLRVIEAEFRTNPLSARRFVLSDFLGATVLQRVINRLQICEVDPICILGDPHHPASVEFAHSPVDGPQPSFQNLWAEAEQLFLQFAQREIDFVFLIRLGTYAELDFVDLLQFHRENGEAFTCVEGTRGPVHIFVLSLAKGSGWADALKSVLRREPSLSARYKFYGYINPLASAYDFRRLAQDALAGRCDLKPVGKELRPGIWVGEGAAIDRRARILAPAYVGAHAEIMAAALITRGSAIEHHCQVDCGTVVDDSSVLPYTYLGPGLEVTHAVVDGGRLLHLARNIEVQIADRRLIGPTHSASARHRTGVNPLKSPTAHGIRGLVAPTECVEPASFHKAGEIAPSS